MFTHSWQYHFGYSPRSNKIDIKYSLPIQKRLYPSHYALLYFIKGDKPAIFHPDRQPVSCCRHCGGELRDYGGYKDKMNPKGVNLSDVWTDIPPVRHAKYKTTAMRKSWRRTWAPAPPC